LHDQSKMFEGSTITKANPASFSFTVPLTIEKDESIVIDLLSDLAAGLGKKDPFDGEEIEEEVVVTEEDEGTGRGMPI